MKLQETNLKIHSMKERKPIRIIFKFEKQTGKLLTIKDYTSCSECRQK